MNRTLLTLAATLTALPVAADEFTPAMREFYEAELQDWASNAVVIDALRAQNRRTMGYSQDQIDALDTAWRAEVGGSDTPTISPVMENAAADYLRDRVARMEGRVTEVFIMDARGLNVAASDVTSDYWQGDEAKFQETYGSGPDAVHISDVEMDDSTQRYQGQVSMTVVDPETGEPLGAMTVGVDAESLL